MARFELMQPPEAPKAAETAAPVTTTGRFELVDKPPEPNVIDDVWRSAVTGGQKGLSALAGMVGDIQRGLLKVSQNKKPPTPAEQMRADARAGGSFAQSKAAPGPIDESKLFRGSENFNDDWSNTFGEQHTPQTLPGKYAETAGMMATSALAKGSAGTRALRVAAPAVASETAGQVTKGTPLEIPARVAAGVGASLAAERGIAASASANAKRAAVRSPTAEAEALEKEFGPYTAGERSGNARQRLEEDDMRRGIGSDRAASTMRAFDAKRAQVIRDNVMKIVTRGKDAISQNKGEAGTILADQLRTNRQQIRQLATAQYKKAFDLAKAEQVAPSDALPSRIMDEALEYGFEVPSGAQAAIKNLQDKVIKGVATHGDVERARQALSRERGAAINARDDAKEFVFDRVINALDDWQEGLIANPQAKQAMSEARGIFKEGQQLYTPQGRIELSTGQVGRVDLGGWAIDKVVNTDLTGEQIIDSLVGAGTKPSQQALAAVKRIKQLGTETIKYSGTDSTGGVRAPGRLKKGGVTAGEKRYAADDPNAPGGAQLPTDELQALREGFWHRVLSPLDDYITRIDDAAGEGGLLPAQRLVKEMDNALNKGGKEIMEQIYTPRELAQMRRAQAYLQRIVPPPGAAVSGTHPAFHRLLSKWFDMLVGIIPGVGPAIREATEAGNSTAAARKAIAPPNAPKTVAPTQPYAPSYSAPALAGVNAYGEYEDQ